MEGKLHRTQISIEDWQFQTLIEISKKTKRSMSSIIREILAEKLLNKSIDKKDIEKDPISELLGIGIGNGSPVAEEHDKYLYDQTK